MCFPIERKKFLAIKRINSFERNYRIDTPGGSVNRSMRLVATVLKAFNVLFYVIW